VFDEPGITVEDPFVFVTGGHFEMIAKDLNGQACGEYHAGVHLLSSDGKNWSVAPDPKAYSRTVQWNDGRPMTVSSFERPQLLMQNGVPTHLFAAMADGPGGPDKWNLMSRTWTGVIPLDPTVRA
jgi:hypothetical protein